MTRREYIERKFAPIYFDENQMENSQENDG